jgi:hypothetical protein
VLLRPIMHVNHTELGSHCLPIVEVDLSQTVDSRVEHIIKLHLTMSDGTARIASIRHDNAKDRLDAIEVLQEPA